VRRRTLHNAVVKTKECFNVDELKPKLLIVDDDKFIRKVLFDMLVSEQRYNIFLAKNGAEALEQMELHKPQVVLLDYSMPDMSGLDVLRVIKVEYPKSIVIIVTGKSDEKIALKLMLEGASDYISKSPNLDELHYKIDRAMVLCEQEFRIDQLENRFTDMLFESKKIIESWNILKSCFAEGMCEEKVKIFENNLHSLLSCIRKT